LKILEVIQNTSKFFEKRGIESPRLQIELLLAHFLCMKRMDLYMQFERELSEAELGPLRDAVKKRSEGVPLQHLTGDTGFYGEIFKVSPSVLIPRPETEILIEHASGFIKALDAPRILDVGTGSGVIAVMLAKLHPSADITAVDISSEALLVARINAERVLGPDHKVRFVEGDLLLSVEGPFDMIISNPPYIASEVIPTLSREVQHDPKLALDGGVDGLQIIRDLIMQSSSKLKDSGRLFVEIGYDQSKQCLELLAQGGYENSQVIQDLTGRDRVITGGWGSSTKS